MNNLLIWFWLYRLANAFAYYGIVLVTTELFQVDDVCSGMSADLV